MLDNAPAREWDESEFGAALDRRKAGGPIAASGVRISSEQLQRLRQAGLDPDSDELILENADFEKAIFQGDAEFYGATFKGHANFYGATFEGDAIFSFLGGPTFEGMASFSEAAFKGDADFSRATFEASAGFAVRLSRARPGSAKRPSKRMPSSKGRALSAHAQFRGGADLLVRWAHVVLDDADFADSSMLAPGVDPMRGESALQGRLDRRRESIPRLMSLRRAGVGNLTIAGADLRACRFEGAFGLDQLRLEQVFFAETPRGWQQTESWPMPVPIRWTRRQTIAEEHHWRIPPAAAEAVEMLSVLFLIFLIAAAFFVGWVIGSGS